MKAPRAGNPQKAASWRRDTGPVLSLAHLRGRVPSDDVAQPTADAFEVLANENRLDVLLALLRAQERPDLPYPIGFAALHDETAIDYSSQLSYHLEVLVDDFVEKRETGYALSVAGAAIAWFVRSEVLEDHRVREDVRAVGACYACGERALVGSYEDYQFRLDCEACGEAVLRTAIRPTAVRDRSDAEVLDVIDTYVRGRSRLLATGSCPQCFGRVDGTLVDGPTDADRTPGTVTGDRAPSAAGLDHTDNGVEGGRNRADTDGGDRRHDGFFGGAGAGGTTVRYRCRECGHSATMPAGRRALADPQVQRFFAERGASLDEGRLWDYPFAVDQGHGERRHGEGDGVVLELASEGSTLYVEVDADGGLATSTTDPSALRL